MPKGIALEVTYAGTFSKLAFKNYIFHYGSQLV